MVRRKKQIGALVLALAVCSPVLAQNMKVEINRWDFEWIKNSSGTDRLFPNPGEFFGWGTPSFPNEQGIPYAGERCLRFAGVNTGFGVVISADPMTQANTLYQAEWMVKNTGTLPGRAQFELAHITASGYQERNYWTKDTWVKDSLSWRTPASIDIAANAVILWIASKDNEGNSLGLPGGFYMYLDDVVLYKIVPKAPAPPKIEHFTRAPDGQPKDTTVAAGQTAMFMVLASGLAPLSYQWKKDGQPVAGATSRLLRISNTSGADAGKYSCTVTNDDGSATSSEATLTVTGETGTSASRSDIARGVSFISNGHTVTGQLAAAGPWSIALYGVDGKLMRSVSGHGTECHVAVHGLKGVALARLTSSAGSQTIGIISRPR